MQNLKKNWLVVWKATWGISQSFTTTLESLKIGTLWDHLIKSRKSMSLKFTEEVCVMTMKNDAKFEEKLTCRFKIDMRNLTNLTRALERLQNFHLNALLLNKVYIAWAKKVQTGYLSRHWREIQSLERNQLVVSKLTQKIRQILTRTLESLNILCLDGLLVTKVYNVLAKKVQIEEFSFMTLKSNTKFKEKPTCGLKNDMINFHQSTWKSQNSDFDGILLPKVENVWS